MKQAQRTVCHQTPLMLWRCPQLHSVDAAVYDQSSLVLSSASCELIPQLRQLLLHCSSTHTWPISYMTVAISQQ